MNRYKWIPWTYLTREFDLTIAKSVGAEFDVYSKCWRSRDDQSLMSYPPDSVCKVASSEDFTSIKFATLDTSTVYVPPTCGGG